MIPEKTGTGQRVAPLAPASQSARRGRRQRPRCPLPRPRRLYHRLRPESRLAQHQPASQLAHRRQVFLLQPTYHRTRPVVVPRVTRASTQRLVTAAPTMDSGKPLDAFDAMNDTADMFSLTQWLKPYILRNRLPIRLWILLPPVIGCNRIFQWSLRKPMECHLQELRHENLLFSVWLLVCFFYTLSFPLC